ncbi:MAG: integrase arm-type DNA-binding domain-containing protein, partial [Pseudomonadota bacterium]
MICVLLFAIIRYNPAPMDGIKDGTSMARPIHKLNDRAVRSANKSGAIADGGGLYLRVKSSGSKSWSFRWKKGGKKTEKGHVIPNEIGLGPYPAVSLLDARRRAAEFREILASGGDPRSAKAKSTEPTFAECISMFLQAKEGEWSNEKHRQQWRNTLGQYCSSLSDRNVASIGLSDVLAVLQPIWNEKPETASRLRGRIERVLSYAQTRGWRTDSNPAVWRGNLENVLPRPRKLYRGHHKAMAWQEVPEFVAKLEGHQALAARALQLVIFTVCRSGEVLNAEWSEFDLENGIWTIPAERMKARHQHRVPLTDATTELLVPLSDLRLNDWVFPGQKKGRPLSGMSMEMLLRRMKVTDATVHGFRSSFRDWAGDETNHPREVAEECLAHRIGNLAERAYRRSDALEK